MSQSLNRIRKIIAHVDIPHHQNALTNKPCMKQYTNESVTLASFPGDDVLPSNFKIKRESINTLNDGDILVEIKCISIDAYLRTTMYEKPIGKLHETVPLGGKIHSLAYGKIIESRNNQYKTGEYVTGGFLVEKYAVITKKSLDSNQYQKIVSPSGDPKDLRYYLTYLGIATGCSAYAGVYYATTKKLNEGDIAVVNAASG